MAILQPGHPKSKSSGSTVSGGPTENLLEDNPPPEYSASAIYDPAPNSTAATEDHGTSSRSALLGDDPYRVTSIEALNPESSKKLANEARERGHELGDYGFSNESRRPPFGTPGSGAEALPPTFAFTEHRANYQVDSSGNITSHDPALNSSPDQLYRFLKLHASSPPSLTIHLRGSHIEKRTTHHVHQQKNGHQRHHTKVHDEEVEDFSFSIDAGYAVEAGLGGANAGRMMAGVMYEVGEWDVAYRGGSWKETGVNTSEESGKHKSTARIRLPEEAEVGSDHRSKWRTVGLRGRRRLEKRRRSADSQGLPGFIDPASMVDIENDLRSEDDQQENPALLYKTHFVDLVETHTNSARLHPVSADLISPLYRTVLQGRDSRAEAVKKIVEDYCASRDTLKELKIKKELYGWNWSLLEAALRSSVESAGYSGTTQVQFVTTPSTIIIRPENGLSRIFSLPIWVKILLWIVLFYPILLLIEHFSGSRWSNIRVAFPLTRWRRAPAAESRTSHPSDRTITLPTDGSSVVLIGYQEGEFLRYWEAGIVHAVKEGKRGVVLSLQDVTAGRERPDARLMTRGYA